MKVDYKPSPRYAEYVRKITCGDWEPAGIKGNDRGVLLHTKTGATVSYGLHDGGNALSGPRNFAADVQRICGCPLVEPRGRKRSRKNPARADPAFEAARQRHHDQYLAEKTDEDTALKTAARLAAVQSEVGELSEACRHMANALRKDPNSRSLRVHYERLRRELAALLQKSADIAAG